MYTGDQGISRSEPWTYSRKNLPIRVYSDRSLVKCGKNRPKRTKARRKKHNFSMADAERIIHVVLAQEAPSVDGLTFANKLLLFMQDTTQFLMQKIIPFLDDKMARDLYWFIHENVAKFFHLPLNRPTMQSRAVYLCQTIADSVGLQITFPKP